MAVDLNSIPKPQVIEEITYAAIVARKKATFQALWNAVRTANPDMPPYDVLMLKTDAAMIVIEADATDEMLLRARINDSAKANILPWSTGNDLAILAQFGHGVAPIDGETEDQLKERVILKEQGSSSAGPKEWYQFHARSVSADVREVEVLRPGTGPELQLAILSFSNGGVAPDALLDAIRAKVTADNVRGDNDIVTVVRAVRAVIDIEADIWLRPSADYAVFEALEPNLRAAWDKEGKIGADLLKGWISARLTPAGVYKAALRAPLAEHIAALGQAFAIGNVKLNFMGRDE